MQLLKCRLEDVDNLKTFLAAKNYLSHDIIDEKIEIMANYVLQDLLTKIRAVNYFAVIGDETRDVSNKEQFAVSVRWVTQDYVIHEDLMPLSEVEQTGGATLTSELKKSAS